MRAQGNILSSKPTRRILALIAVVLISALSASEIFAQHMPTRKHPSNITTIDTLNTTSAEFPPVIPIGEPITSDDAAVIGDSIDVTTNGLITMTPVDTVNVKPYNPYDDWVEREVAFNPDPTRAVWLSALFPGLGQIYNRRYWKLPIVVGAYLGLGYATSWNNGMLTDYTRAYRDIMDTDPTTKSYMNFFPSTVKEENLDKTWLTNVLQSRKNFYRRNRDLCVICMIGVYLVAMVDAYVDASLSHFDISPELTVDVAPAVFLDGRNTSPSVGVLWAFTF